MDRSTKDSTWYLYALPSLLSPDILPSSHLFLVLLLSFLSLSFLTWTFSPAGPAWAHNNRARMGRVPLPGPRGLPFIGSLLSLTRGLPHRTLDRLARSHASTRLLAFSLGSTPAVVSTDPATAKEILSHPSFSDRPLKMSARELMFGRAIGFAPNGPYWRLLRRISSTHLFSPRRVAAHEPGRQLDADVMMASVSSEMASSGRVVLRPHLQAAALNNIMGSVFGRRYDVGAAADTKVVELQEMVREGFELLGAFNWADHLPWLAHFYDPANVKARCADLVPRVRRFVKEIIEDHKVNFRGRETKHLGDNADFVDVLLSLEGDEMLGEDEMIAVLWEMIFRGTDTTALLTEWAIAELVLNPRVQERLRREINAAVGPAARAIADADVARMPYLQAVVKETLRTHPPGPLLSWARLSTDDVQLSNGMVVPAGTTAMVNMWGITHDPSVWAEPDVFRPERFVEADVDVRGSDLRLAPFGAGRRVCPGKNLGLVTVGLWIARLVHKFEWAPVESHPVDLSEVLKLSCEMKYPLTAAAVPASQ